jgi:hypothetical protein
VWARCAAAGAGGEGDALADASFALGDVAVFHGEDDPDSDATTIARAASDIAHSLRLDGDPLDLLDVMPAVAPLLGEARLRAVVEAALASL